MRLILTLTFIMLICYTTSSQNLKEAEIKPQTQSYSYAYIVIEGKGFSKKLKVDVDLGDSPDQIKSGKEYSDILTNKKSYAAILNYMSENQFELLESIDNSLSVKDTGGPSGIVFIMRKKITNANKE